MTKRHDGRGGAGTALRVRFWIWHPSDHAPECGSFVRLTATEGAPALRIARGGSHEEGNACEVTHYWVEPPDGGNAYLRMDHDEWGRDCDGPYSRESASVAPIVGGRLRTCLHPYRPAREEIPGGRVPEWVRIGSSQRDAYAEAMGY